MNYFEEQFKKLINDKKFFFNELRQYLHDFNLEISDIVNEDIETFEDCDEDQLYMLYQAMIEDRDRENYERELEEQSLYSEYEEEFEEEY